jgi:hypothetical protein
VLEQEGEKGDLGLLTVGNCSNGPGAYKYTRFPLNSGAIEGARLRIQGFGTLFRSRNTFPKLLLSNVEDYNEYTDF